jgi:hypothetical protein
VRVLERRARRQHANKLSPPATFPLWWRVTMAASWGMCMARVHAALLMRQGMLKPPPRNK